jgi:hypothetical protein
MIETKKAQHETVGFVLIIIIVAIIGLVFLWFYLSSPATLTNSAKMSDLLKSSLYYTTDCYESYIPNYKTGWDLIKESNKNPKEKCFDGRTYEQALNDTFKKIIQDSLKVGEDVPIKGYRLRFYFDFKGEEIADKQILFLEGGKFFNCTKRYGGSNPISDTGGSIETRLEICEKNN